MFHFYSNFLGILTYQRHISVGLDYALMYFLQPVTKRVLRCGIKSGPCTWWRHQMDTFSALLAICERNPPVTGGFPSQRPVTRNFDAIFDLRLNKQSRCRLFETPSHSVWRHCNDIYSRCNRALYEGVNHIMIWIILHAIIITWTFVCMKMTLDTIPSRDHSYSLDL